MTPRIAKLIIVFCTTGLLCYYLVGDCPCCIRVIKGFYNREDVETPAVLRSTDILSVWRGLQASNFLPPPLGHVCCVGCRQVQRNMER